MIEISEMKIKVSKYSLPSALLDPENPFPIFRDRKQDSEVKFDAMRITMRWRKVGEFDK